MDDINMIPNEEQIANDLSVEETKAKKKLSKGKIILISVASFVGVLLLFLCVICWSWIGAPYFDFGLDNENITGKSYARYLNIYGGMNGAHSKKPNIALTEKGELLAYRSRSDIESYFKKNVRINLNFVNFDSLITNDNSWKVNLSNGDRLTNEYIRENYVAAWVEIDWLSKGCPLKYLILMNDGNLMYVHGYLFMAVFNNKIKQPAISYIDAYGPYGDIQEFYKYAGVE